MLQRTRAFVGRADTVTFEGDGRLEISGEDAAADESVVQRIDIRGEGVIGERHHVVQDLGDVVFEELAIGGTTYLRRAEGVDDLDGEQWGQFDADDLPGGVVLPGRPPAVAAAEALTPAGLDLVLEEVSDVRGQRRADGGWSLEVATEAADLFRRLEEDFGVDVDEVDVELDVDETGRPARYRVVLGGDGLDGSLDFGTIGWGAPVELEAPDDDDLDPTPFVDEAALADFDEAPVLVLGEVPTGWVLDAGYTVSAEETDGCEEVQLDYIDPVSESGYLFVTVLAADCADTGPPAGAIRFDAAGGEGWVLEEGDGYTRGAVVVGDTAVVVDTDLPAASVQRLLESLRPYDPRTVTQPAEVDGLTAGLTG